MQTLVDKVDLGGVRNGHREAREKGLHMLQVGGQGCGGVLGQIELMLAIQLGVEIHVSLHVCHLLCGTEVVQLQPGKSAKRTIRPLQ
jgi:hypothetical protein